MKEAFKAAKANKEHVILGVPMRECVIREITIPFTEVDQIRKVIKFESESHLHSCSIDDVVVCFHKVAESGNRSTIIVLAAKKESIRRQLAALEKIGVDPLMVDLDAAGLFGLCRVLKEPRQRKNYVVCEIGYSSTMITLVQDENLRILRSVRMGTDSITSRVSKDLDIDREEAQTRTQAILTQDLAIDDDLMVRQGDVLEDDDETAKSSSELERDIVRQRQTELTTRLSNEIYRSITPAKLEEDIDCIYLTGPGSNLPRINAELAETMGLPVKTLNILDEMDHRFKTADIPIYNAAMPAATGLALKHLGHDPLQLDFRQEEFVFARKFDRLKVPLFCLIILMAALNLFCAFYLKKIGNLERDKLNRAATRAAEIFRKAADPDKLDAETLRYVPYKEEELKSIYRGAQTEDDRSSFDRIGYMGRSLMKMHTKLREDYSLGNAEGSKKQRGRRRSTGSKDIPEDASEFLSALDRWEMVSKAIEDTGIQYFAMNRLEVNIDRVQFGLTLPREAKVGEQVLDFQEIIAKIKSNLEALPKEAKFLRLLDLAAMKPSVLKDGFVDYPSLVAEFVKEAR